MKPVTTTALGVAAAFLIVACVALEDRLARVTTPDIATNAISAGCTGGREFIAAATASLDPTAAALLAKGVETACALRAKRTTISATVYDGPLDTFCAQTTPLTPADAAPQTRAAFNAKHSNLCEVRP